MTVYESLKQQLHAEPKTWSITGIAGFIGSNLLETLLKLNQRVVGLDNFSIGHQRNLDEVEGLVAPDQWANFYFIQGDIRNLDDCRRAMVWSAQTLVHGLHSYPVDYVLHQAALGSVPRSIEDPITTNQNNIDGFLNMLVASRDLEVKSFIYAASSSTYGDHPDLPKVEDKIGKPLSPYAVTKLVNELYADVFAKTYGFRTIGLRYFNIFGPRQDPNGAYAAVIPKWTNALLKRETVYINGDGESSRDFCFVANAVQANILAACAINEAGNQVFNVAVGDRTTLNKLFESLRDILISNGINVVASPTHRDFREGDVRHSQANISKAQRLLGYVPNHNLEQGLAVAMPWYIKELGKTQR